MKRQYWLALVVGLALTGLCAAVAVAGPPTTPAIDSTITAELVINELDADQTGTDNAEFIELYDGGYGNTSLDGLVIVLFNGNGDVSYQAFDLDSHSTDANGYFVLCGDASNVPNCDLDVTPDTNLIQNGADAAALFLGDDSDFPNGTDVTNTNLIDAIVYDTSDADDPELLSILLNSGQPQVNENGGGSGTTHSNQRCPNGSGGQRNTDTYTQIGPTSGLANDCRPDLTIDKTGPALALPGRLVTYTIAYENDGTGYAYNVVISDTLPNGVHYVTDNSGLACPACILNATGAFTWYVGTFSPTETAMFNLTAWVTPTTPLYTYITNTVDITTTSTESDADNNDEEWASYVSQLDLIVDKEGPEYAAVGKNIVYALTLDNLGVVDAAGVIVTDSLPISTTYVADDSGWTCPSCTPGATGVITWDAGKLVSDTLYTFNLTVTVDVSVTSGTVLTNRVEASTATPGDLLHNNKADWETTAYSPLHIHEIQGARHFSDYDGQVVNYVPGIVTALAYNGFYMQDPNPDANDGTSEAIFVYTGGAPTVSVGDELLVDGDVSEYYPGGYASGNLSTSEIENATIAVLNTGQALPAPIVIGDGGRVPPDQVIDDDATGDVETTGTFDYNTDGIDFWESLEAMLVQVNNPVVVGGTDYGTISVVGDSGVNAGLLAPRGGIVVRSDDFNPERIIVDDAIVDAEPTVNVGASFAGPIAGVVGYSYGVFNLLNVESLPATSGGVVSETTTAAATNQLRVASFNVYNLDPGDNATRVAGLAGQIVNNLQSPDIIGLEEIQDNNGETNDGTVAADQTYNMLITAIQVAGGPTYQYRQVDPQDNQDGGAPGSNIRVGFLFRTDRGLAFVDRPGGDATTAVGVTMGATGVELTLSPGRIDPTNVAFNDSRKPLAGEFTFNGQKLIVVVNHFSSKSGDAPTFGRVQPPVLASEVQRNQQAQVVNDFVDDVLALDSTANVIVLGDLNDFQFSVPVSDTLAADVLTDLVNTLPITEAYTYIYQGNSQVLDHILLGHDLFDRAFVDFDIVHVNAEFAYSYLRPSDHDPVVATLLLAPDFSGSTKTVDPSGDVSAGDLLTYTITLSNSGAANVTVSITDTLPAELILVKGLDGGGLTWSGVVTAGEEVALTLVVQADPSLTTNTTVSNVVTIDDSVNAAFDIHSPETTILAPGLTVAKDVAPATDLPLGGIVTYTITLNNGGDGLAAGVVMTDELPAEVSFGGWVQQSGALQANDTITWTGDVAMSTQVIIVFTATVGVDADLYGRTVTNTAYIVSDNAGSSSGDVTFAIKRLTRVYLPLVSKSH